MRAEIVIVLLKMGVAELGGGHPKFQMGVTYDMHSRSIACLADYDLATGRSRTGCGATGLEQC